MNADQIAVLRAKARRASGDFIALNQPGDWFAGHVVGHQTVYTQFGEVEELIVRNATVNGEQRPGDTTFRLSRSVLQRELGSDAEEPPKSGDAVFVEYLGTRTGKSGRSYHAYGVSKEPGDLPAPSGVAATGAQGVAPDDSDIPF